MNLNLIKGYLEENALDKESLVVGYDFLNFSGNFIKNQAHSGELQFSGDNNTSYLAGVYNPGIFNKLNENITPGSGKFTRDNFLKTTNPFQAKSFACIIKYQNELNDLGYKDGLGEILLSIDHAPSGPKTFVGLNDLKKIFLDFSGSNFYSIDLDNQIARNNILALNYVNDILYLYHMNLFDKKIVEKTIEISGEHLGSGNKIFFFGGTENGNYTGFYGNINNILIFDNSLSKNDILNISFLIEKTGDFVEEEYTNYTGFYQESGYINPTGILDIGLINYNTIQNNTIVRNINDNINTYINLYSGITGYITGEKIEYKKIEIIQKILTGQSLINLYDNNSINLYSGIHSSEQNIFDANTNALFDNNFERFI